MIDLKWLEEVDAQVCEHALFSEDEGSAQVAGSKRFQEFRGVTLAVASLNQAFLQLAECGLASNVTRFRDLSYKREWSAAELKHMMDWPKRVERFSAQQGLNLEANARGICSLGSLSSARLCPQPEGVLRGCPDLGGPLL